VVAAAPRFGLVVVDKFNVFRTLRSPDETNSELIVHADRIPALTVAPERFEPIGRRCPQIVENDCRVQVAQLAARHLDQAGREALADFAVEGCFGQGVLEALDHDVNVSMDDTSVNSLYQYLIRPVRAAAIGAAC
jgi:hypothetical protein